MRVSCGHKGTFPHTVVFGPYDYTKRFAVYLKTDLFSRTPSRLICMENALRIFVHNDPPLPGYIMSSIICTWIRVYATSLCA